MTHLIFCPLCNSAKYRKKFNVGGKQIVKCEKCSLVYMRPLPTMKEMKAFYDSEYFVRKGARRSGYMNYLELESMFLIMYRNWLKKLLPYMENREKKGRVLEIGCAAGYFLNIAAEYGYEVYGVEPSPIGIQAKKKHKNIYLSTFEEVQLQDKVFDLIVFFDVLEHISEPAEFLNKVISHLKHGGIIAISFPNIESIFCKIFGRHWIHFKEDHLIYYSPDTLKKLSIKHKLKIIQMKNCVKVTNLKFIINRLEDYYGLKFPVFIKKIFKNWKIFELPFPFFFSGELFAVMKRT